MKRAAGFTLIELLVVLTIIGVVLSLVGPVAFRQYERTQVLQEREQLYRILEHVRFYAVIQRQPATLTLTGRDINYQSAGDVSDHWQFEHLLFTEQQLNLNSHGVWQQQHLYWSEYERELELALNPEPVQQQRTVTAPSARVVTP